MLTPVLFGTSGLDSQASAAPLESWVSLVGIVLLTPIFQPEQNPHIREIVSSKWMSQLYVHLIRLIYSGAALLALIGLFVLYMKFNDCKVTLPLMFGTVASAVFLGSLGMLSSAATNNTAAAYMIPASFYAMNLVGGVRLGSFDLFSMMDGQYDQKIWLLASSAVMVSVSLVLSAAHSDRVG
ncbi:ABC transporter permease [Cohnella faecalis]|uniref:ABC transporter permease n=2 Tax=Cohnella faecalis TaxID=2315694 RepID=A0A398CJF0_9BACL|nr:ABC transporter permease [Cohnella faecalis]RIE02450.1 ABC transporter permease [Cohnella faecalis]